MRVILLAAAFAVAAGAANAKDRDEPKFPVFTAPAAKPAVQAAQPEPRAAAPARNAKRNKARAAR